MKPRLLDLFCGAGGCSMGFHRAGFEVVGVDIQPQPRYPFEFVQMDAIEALRWLLEDWTVGGYRLHEFAGFHASPPCQRRTKAQRLRGNAHPRLIGPARELLQATGRPYVIENTPTDGEDDDPLEDPVMLCGTMFGLPLYRHRLFECSFAVTAPLHGPHWLPQVKMGRKPGPDQLIQPVGNFTGADEARAAMDIDWMARDELAQAIPPAYTEHIGGYLMAELRARAAA